MALLEKMEVLSSFTARGKFGFSSGFGATRFGYNRIGFFSPYSGIYQRKRTLKGWRWSRSLYYRTPNPRTIKQQNWRAVCAYAWIIWATFSSEKKEIYRLDGRKLNMSGPNLFTRQWLRQPTHSFGTLLFGYNGFGL